MSNLVTLDDLAARLGLTGNPAEYVRERGYKVVTDVGISRGHGRGCCCPRHRSRHWLTRSESMSRAYDTAAYRRYAAQLRNGNYRCHLCGEPGADTVDHRLPLSRGGLNALSNWAPAHSRCNTSKRDRVRIRYFAKW